MSELIPESQPTVVGEAPAQTAPEPAPTEAAPAPEAATTPPPAETTQEKPAEVVGNRYEKSLEALMARARDTRKAQLEAEQQRQALEFTQRVQQAAQYGPDAVMKALGMEQKKLDLSAILGEEDDGEPPTVKELKKKVSELEAFINQEKQTAAQRQEQERKQQMTAWESQEVSKIETFLQNSKDKYEFTAELVPVGSTRDIYSGIINMYQQGYTPSYEDMAELVETRIEDILDRLAGTKKFQSWAASRLKAQSAPPAQSAPTLKGTLNADSVASAPHDDETDEQNRQRALKAAYAAREAALKRLKDLEPKA